MMLLEPKLTRFMKIWVDLQGASSAWKFSKIKLNFDFVFFKMLLDFNHSCSYQCVHLDTNILASLIPDSHVG